MGSRWTGRQNDRYGQAAWVTPSHRAPTLVLSRRDDRMVLFGAAKALAAKICTTLDGPATVRMSTARLTGGN